MSDPRRCYIILADQFDDAGFIPSVVVEGEQGHTPLMGNGAFAQPWHWGKTLEAAQKLCAKLNGEDFGLSPDDVTTIVASSLGVTPRVGVCPVCGGPVTQVPKGRSPAGKFECATAERKECDRFFRADELAEPNP